MLVYIALYILLNLIIFVLADVNDAENDRYVNRVTIIIPLKNDIKGACEHIKVY